ncbi:MAG TPA: enoyl-CoA hydratase/isomerase family protein [Stellaceae bacterium]|nr:enoyl-CoA hydratase/isomerase family protein [Stellaceae bacterium]
MNGGGEEILFGRAGGLATILINRPQALNSLTLANYRLLAPKLARWARDESVHAVAIRGAGGRAFCAGGDIRAIYEAGRGIAGDPRLTSVFFREEYELIRQVHRFPKPYVAVVDGITMGGGAGMSVNGAYRVATERTAFAMPETAIGLFPDVGATRFLNRCPGRIGRYLGLTGARLGAADALYCGFATHFVPQGRVEAFYAALGGIAWGNGAQARQIEAVLAGLAGDPGPAPIARLRPVIDRIFAAASVEAILDALVGETGEWAGWAEETRVDLDRKSPLSLEVTLRQLDMGRDYDLDAALALEYRLTQHFMQGHDFYEGVRAMLIDKDRAPRWRPASLAEVDAALVDFYFAPLGEGELRFD